MVKKIISRITVFFASLLIILTALNTLEVSVDFPNLVKQTDVSGQELPTAVVNEIFSLSVEINHSSPKVDKIDVKGLDAFIVIQQSQGQSVTAYNGAISRTTTINAQIKATKPGKFKIGPVHVQAGKETASSGDFYCQVIEQSAPPQANTSTHTRPAQAAGMEIELIPSKREVYWGEPLEITIRYIATGNVFEFAPEIPEQVNFLTKDQQNRGQREIIRNGRKLPIHEHVITYLPVRTGPANIGPIAVHYSVATQQKRHRGGFSGFDILFGLGPQVEHKTAHSTALNILVKPLPKTKEKVSIVGTISKFDLSVDKPSVEVNEPIKLVASITGRGNLDFVEDLPLKLPDGFREFKSKTFLHRVPGTSGIVTKSIEYVLQINRSGHIELPGQKLLYFDPESEIYKTIESNNLELFLSGEAVEPAKKTIDELAKEVNSESEQNKTSNELAYIFDNAGNRGISLSWWLFFILLLLPLFIHLQRVKAFITKCLSRYEKKPSQKDILFLASKELTKLVQSGKADKLHQFFIKTLAALWQIHEQEVTENFIEAQLEKFQWEESRIKEFIDFMHTCTSLHFTKQTISEEVHSALLKKSQYWVLLLGTPPSRSKE